MLFSIIATDYEGSVNTEILQKFIDSLKAQTFKDFEVIILHDGSRSVELDTLNTEGLNIVFEDSLFRAKLWGHNLRTIGIKKAIGEFILHTNTDNIYYPTALEDIANTIKEYKGVKVFIGQIKMMGLNKVQIPIGTRIYYDNPRDYSKHTILTGNPPAFGNIDLMSLISHKDCWEKIGYWYDLREASDSVIYADICSKFRYVFIDKVLGEHY